VESARRRRDRRGDAGAGGRGGEAAGGGGGRGPGGGGGGRARPGAGPSPGAARGGRGAGAAARGGAAPGAGGAPGGGAGRARRAARQRELLERPLELFTARDVAEARDLVRELGARLRGRLARRERALRRGRLDLRRTLRVAVTSGGVPVRLRRRGRRPGRPDLI